MAMTDAGSPDFSVANGEAAASAPAAAEAPAPDHQTRDLTEQMLELLQQAGGVVDVGKSKMHELALQRRELGKEKRRLTAALRNETRKRQRVMKKSMHLSNEDLVDVLTMRKCKEDKAQSVSQAKDAGEYVEPKKRGPNGALRQVVIGTSIMAPQ